MSASEPATAQRPASYRALWRWHFFAGLFVAPVLILLAITGAIYLFDREIEGWWHSDKQSVTASGATLPLASQEAAVLRAFPESKVARVTLPHGPGEASKWKIEEPSGRALYVFVDPYRARVTGTVNPDDEPMAFIRRIHGTLLGGEIGSHVVELVACWTLVMLVTGLLMWWPRTWKARGVFVPRFSATGRRFWRDLHSIPAAFNMALIGLLILTGLPWSAFWGVQFARLGEVIPFIAPTPNFSSHMPAAKAAPIAATADPHAAHRTDVGAPLPWVIQNSPQPRAAHAGAIGIATIERYFALLEQPRYGGGLRVFYPQDPGDTFMVNYIPDQAEGQRTIHIDPADGQMLANIGWADYSPVGKLIEWGTMLHMGRQYGVINQYANLTVCLLLIGSIFAGLKLWWQRRPAKALGAPQLAAGDRLPGSVRLLLIALAILFPLVGISLLFVLVVNRLASLRWAD